MMSRSTIALLFILCLLALFEGAQVAAADKPKETAQNTTGSSASVYSTLGAFATVVTATIF